MSSGEKSPAMEKEESRHLDVTEEMTLPRVSNGKKRGVSWNQYVLAVVNTLSGERNAMKDLLKMLESELGADRVYTLDKETFQNPSKLERQIQQCTFIAADNNNSTEERGTVIVAGGDGTVSFVYQVLGRMSVRLSGSAVPTTAQNEINSSLQPTPSAWLLPALAVIPLGTGNDYSNCMGFGTGFKASSSNNCCGSDHTPLKELAMAPSYPFDRWRVTFIPLQRAQACQEDPTSEVMLRAKKAAEVTEAISAVRWDEADQVTPEQDSGSASSSSSINSSMTKTTSYHLINYLGIGFDAYVCTKFDKSRRAHPSICSTRAANKMVYGVHSLNGAVQCAALQKVVPMICVPAVHAHSDEADNSSFVGLALPKSSKALVVSNVDRYAAGCTPWGDSDKPLSTSGVKYREVNIVRDKLVRVGKSLHTEQVNTSPFSSSEVRSSGGNPPSSASSSVVSHSNAANAADHRLSPLKKVAVNDGLVELQSMGGIFHFGNMQMGISTSDKLTQANEAFIFVLCTPQDLLCPPGKFSPFSEKAFHSIRDSLHKKAMASLYVQVDGEPVTPIREAMIVHIAREKGEVYGRCARSSSVE